MWKKYDPITGVLVYEVDPIPYVEIPQEEVNSWKKAHHFYGAVANSCIEKIMYSMLPSETFAEASARLGYGNVDNEETRKWYYAHNILISDAKEW